MVFNDEEESWMFIKSRLWSGECDDGGWRVGGLQGLCRSEAGALESELVLSRIWRASELRKSQKRLEDARKSQ